MHRVLAQKEQGCPKPDIQHIVGRALGFLQNSDPQQALRTLAEYPEITRNSAFACYLAGLICANLGHDAEALPFYDRALALKPDHADTIEARARLLQRAGPLDEAIAAYEALFPLKPAAALSAKAVILHDTGRLDEALTAYRQLAATDPKDATAWYNCGAILASHGDPAEALAYFGKALTLDPSYVMALYGAASAFLKLGQPEEALAFCTKLLQQNLDNYDAWFLRGNILYSVGHALEALAAFERALELKPGDLAALCNLGETLRQLGRFPEAAAAFRKALEQNPTSVDALLGVGIIQFKNAQAEEALATFNAALAIEPENATALTGRGLASQDLGQFEEALADFNLALALDPGLVEGHSNLGALQLLLGDFEHGWEGYEYRKLWGGQCKANEKADWPVWNGEPAAGKKLLILDEAAHGDIVMLARYFPILGEMGVDAVFQCRPHMHELIKNVPGVRLVWELDPSEQFDYQVHLFSLPRALGTRLDTIPARVPYITADPGLADKWASLIGDHGFKIGICWQGNPDPKVDMARSAPLTAFAPLAAIKGVRLISLQKGFATRQIAGCGMPVETLGEEFDAGPDAFADTAAVMANLDLIVSVDTSLAHLAGAMGRPVFVALKHVPEWRWLLERPDSPWYPTMRLFRQHARGNWGTVFASMAKEAKAMETPAEPLAIPAAIGELFDKITILEIKADHIADPRKRSNVERELDMLQQVRKTRNLFLPGLDVLIAKLKKTNLALWNIEDAIRRCERAGDFGPGFIELARSVYTQNDRRAAIKREINMLFTSVIIEEKYFPAA